MAAADDVAQDLVLTANRAVVALDRADWQEVLDAAKRLQDHAMALTHIATRQLTSAPQQRRQRR